MKKRAMVLAFGATSVFFGVMALIGYFTNADLSRLRNFLMGVQQQQRPSQES